MKYNKPIRHGDLDLIPSKIPNGAKLETKTNVLMHGENGHEHTLVNGQILIENKVKYVKSNKDTFLIHEEHKKTKIPEGSYILKIEQEFDPYTETLQRVRD